MVRLKKGKENIPAMGTCSKNKCRQEVVKCFYLYLILVEQCYLLATDKVSPSRYIGGIGVAPIVVKIITQRKYFIYMILQCGTQHLFGFTYSVLLDSRVPYPLKPLIFGPNYLGDIPHLVILCSRFLVPSPF